MARAWVCRDSTGRLCVAGESEIDGERCQRRVRVKGDDEALAAEIVRELNGRFLLGDTDWLRLKQRRRPRPKPLRRRAACKPGEGPPCPRYPAGWPSEASTEQSQDRRPWIYQRDTSDWN